MKKFLSVWILAMTIMSCQSQSNNTAKTEPKEAPAVVNEVQKDIKNITVAEAKDLMSTNKDIIILDVRTPEEVAQGSISGAINIDVENPDFVEKIKSLDVNKEYLVYCRSGRRSALALETMEQSGFTKLRNMLGGYLEYSGNK